MTIAYGCWLLRSNPLPISHNLSKNSFDSLINNVHWIEFNDQGEISQEFYSPEIRSYAEQDFYDIINPIFKLVRNQEFWEIQSNFAKAYDDYDKIDLNENVLIKRKMVNNNTPTILKTNHILYLVKEQKVQTKHHVILEQGKNSIQSDGMIANLAEHESLKLGNVLGSYIPEEQPKT